MTNCAHSQQCYISETPRRNFITFGTNNRLSYDLSGIGWLKERRKRKRFGKWPVLYSSIGPMCQFFCWGTSSVACSVVWGQGDSQRKAPEPSWCEATDYHWTSLLHDLNAVTMFIFKCTHVSFYAFINSIVPRYSTPYCSFKVVLGKPQKDNLLAE